MFEEHSNIQPNANEKDLFQMSEMIGDVSNLF